MAGRPKRRARRNSTRFRREKGRRWRPEDQYDLDTMARETLPNGAPRYYFHLHDVLKLGVSSHYYYVTTPLGVYGYPLTPEYLFLLRGKGKLAKIPTFLDRKYVSLLEAVQPDKMLVIRSEDVWGKAQRGEKRIGPISAGARREMKRNPSLNLAAFQPSPEMARERKETARRRRERDAKPFYIYSRAKRGIVPPPEPSTFGDPEEWDEAWGEEPTPEEMAEQAERERKKARRQPILLSQELLRLGYTSVVDLGTGSIHTKEPSQIVFLVPQAYKARGTFPLPRGWAGQENPVSRRNTRRPRRRAGRNPFIRVSPALIELTGEVVAKLIAEGQGYPGEVRVRMGTLPYWDRLQERLRPALLKSLQESFQVGEDADLANVDLLFWVRPLGEGERPRAAATYDGSMFTGRVEPYRGRPTIIGGELSFRPHRGNQPWHYFDAAEHEIAHMLQYLYSKLLGLRRPTQVWGYLGSEVKRPKVPAAFGQFREGTAMSLTGPIEMAPSVGSHVREVVGILQELQIRLGRDRLPPLTKAEVERTVARLTWLSSRGQPKKLRRRLVAAALRGWENWEPRQWPIMVEVWEQGGRESSILPAGTFESLDMVCGGAKYFSDTSVLERREGGESEAERHLRVKTAEKILLGLIEPRIKAAKPQAAAANPIPTKDSPGVRALYAAEGKAREPLAWFDGEDREQRAQETARRMASRYSTPKKAGEMAGLHSHDYPIDSPNWLFWRRVSYLIPRKRRGKAQENPVKDRRMPPLPRQYRGDDVYDPREEAIRAVARGTGGRWGIAVGKYMKERPASDIIQRSWERYQDPDAVVRKRQTYELMLGSSRQSGPYRVTIEPTTAGLKHFVWPIPSGQRKPIPYTAAQAERKLQALLRGRKRPAAALPRRVYTKQELSGWLPPNSIFAGRSGQPTRAAVAGRRKKRATTSRAPTSRASPRTQREAFKARHEASMALVERYQAVDPAWYGHPELARRFSLGLEPTE